MTLLQSQALTLISLHGIGKHYLLGRQAVPVLEGVSLDIQRGEFVAIMGPSGSGKTTLLNVIGCLDSFDKGQYRFDGDPVQAMSMDQIARLRGEHFGFIFQSFNLIPRLSALRNVELPMQYNGVPRAERHARAIEQLQHVGLGDRLTHKPSELSGGQQQRVAIARALVNDPELIVADEPTGALDTQTGESIMALFDELHAAGRTVVMVTHEPDVAARAQRIIRLQDGHLLDDDCAFG